ncbi:hypothetical protein HHX47_DHR2001013 [Lentinula edodes]|nr:hypothetical protein HHX47_DHR2001013 [Lentinula edodes]
MNSNPDSRSGHNLPVENEVLKFPIHTSPYTSDDPAQSLKTTNDAPLTSRLWADGDQYRYAVPPRTGDHWERIMKRIDLYDEDICKGWREDIDTLLVFAGLFSAAVTAFLIESYSWLQQPDQTTNLLLLQLKQQLQSGNDTDPLEASDIGFSVTPLAIRINIFWFSSLALSLSCAIVGILCKQWLREYRRDAALSPRDALMLRQTRLESFEKWKVNDILSALPLLLQAALVLFFAGIVDLLWSLNTVVAVVLTCEIGIALAIVSMTTVLPSLALLMNANLPCAYKSPQAWIFYRLLHSSVRLVERISRGTQVTRSSFRFHLDSIFRIKNWTAGDRLCHRFSNTAASDNFLLNDCLGAAMHWVYSEYRDNVSMTPHIFYCLEELDEETLEIATGKNNLKSNYYLYCDLIKDLPRSQERQKFALELLIRDINANTSSHVQQSLHISHLASELRFGVAVNMDEEFVLQIIHTIRHFAQCSFDGPALSYQLLLEVAYIFLFCWRDGSDDVRRHCFLVLDDLERCIERLANANLTLRAKFGFDFTWLMNQFTGTNPEEHVSQPSFDPLNSFYDPLICSERFSLFVKFLDGYHHPANDVMDPSDPIVSAWKQQKASLAIQGGLPASHFDSQHFQPPPDGSSS